MIVVYEEYDRVVYEVYGVSIMYEVYEVSMVYDAVSGV